MFHGDQPQDNVIEGFESSDSDSDGLGFGDHESDVFDQSGATSMYNSEVHNDANYEGVTQSQADSIIFNGIDSGFMDGSQSTQQITDLDQSDRTHIDWHGESSDNHGLDQSFSSMDEDSLDEHLSSMKQGQHLHGEKKQKAVPVME